MGINKQQYKYILKPFKFWTLQNFPFIESADFDSLTNYEIMCKIVDYLNKVIDNTNTSETNVETAIDYINNFFDNLDVQDEINNKLDSMVEDGTMDEIINQEIFGQLNQDLSNLNTKVDTEIGDLNDLTTINKSNLVDSINLSNYNQMLYLSPFMVYDTNDTHTGHIQGACIHNNILYIARQGDTETTGYIYKFNYNSQQLVDTITNVPLYHGNDMVWINNKIYMCCTTNNTDKRISVYDEQNGTTSVITPFDTLTNYGLVGNDVYDGKLLCWLLDSNNSTSLTHDKMLLLDLTTFEYEDVTINDPNNILKFVNTSVVRQSMTICNNEIYVLLDVPHVLIAGTINDEGVTFNKIYNLPFYDGNNQAINELEGVCKIENDSYPYGSLILTGRTYQTYKNSSNVFGSDTLQTYIVNPKTGSTFLGYSGDGAVQTRENKNYPISVNKSSTVLKEIGSSVYPYKDLIRGINGVNNLTCNDGGFIYIRDSGTYYLPFLYNVKNIHIFIDGSNKPTIYLQDVDCCNITFETIGASSKLTIKSIDTTNRRITLSNSTISFNAAANNIEFNDLQFRIDGGIMRTRRCVVNNSIHASSGYVFSLDNAGTFIDGVNSWTVYSGDKYIQCGGSSIVFTGAGSGNVVKTGGAFVGAINMTQPS